LIPIFRYIYKLLIYTWNMDSVDVLKPLSPCIRSCSIIVERLVAAKHNKKECQALHDVVVTIKGYLGSLCPEELSPAGREALGMLLLTSRSTSLQDPAGPRHQVMALFLAGHLKSILDEAKKLVERLVSMGPLLALFQAPILHQEFQLLHKNLTTQFNVIFSGETLRVGTATEQPRPVSLAGAGGAQKVSSGNAENPSNCLQMLQQTIRTAALQTCFTEQELISSRCAPHLQHRGLHVPSCKQRD
jgi:hypothetical protein